MRTRQKCVATDTWRSLGCRTTPLEHWSRRKPTVEPRWAKQQTKKLRPKPTKINSFMSGPSLSLTPDPPAYLFKHSPTHLLITNQSKAGYLLCVLFFSNFQTLVRFVKDSLVTIYSEKVVLLALFLCCFIHTVKYMMPSLISVSVWWGIWL